jgi:hypothetical protein
LLSREERREEKRREKRREEKRREEIRRGSFRTEMRNTTDLVTCHDVITIGTPSFASARSSATHVSARRHPRSLTAKGKVGAEQHRTTLFRSLLSFSSVYETIPALPGEEPNENFSSTASSVVIGTQRTSESGRPSLSPVKRDDEVPLLRPRPEVNRRVPEASASRKMQQEGREAEAY